MGKLIDYPYFSKELDGWILPFGCKCGGDVVVFTDGKHITGNSCLECLGTLVLPEGKI